MTPTFFAPPDPANVQPPPAAVPPRRRVLVRAMGWALVVSMGFAVGLMARVTFHAEASARDTTIQDGLAEQGYAQMLRVLAEQYFRDVDPDSLRLVDPARLSAELDDRYTHFMTKDEYERYMSDETADTVGLGIDVIGDPLGLNITRVFPNSPAAQGWLLAGDVVTAVDGHSLAGLSVRDGLAILKGEAGSTASISIVRRDVGLVATVTRRPARDWMVDSELRIVDGRAIGYIALMDFSEGATGLVQQAVRRLQAQGAAAIVLDLRGNPGGWAKEAVGVASVFLPNGSPVLIERSVHFDDTTYVTHSAPLDTSTPMAVLVDHDSASSAEILAGALHDAGRALLVGSTTYGKGRIQDIVVLDTGGAFKFTVAEYLTPTGFALDRVGLTPDLSVSGSPAAGADTAFAEAVSRITR